MSSQPDRPVSTGNPQTTTGDADTSPQSQSDTLDALLDRPFAKLDQNALLKPYEDDFHKDAAYEAELTMRVMDLLLELRAWALARPSLETEREGLKLLDQVKEVETRENEQGGYSFFDRTRLGLVKFIQNLKSALEALAGL